MLCMDAGIGSTGNAHVEIVLAFSKYLFKHFDQVALNGAKTWLLCPPSKVSSIICKVHPKANKPARITSGLVHVNLLRGSKPLALQPLRLELR